MVGDAGTGLPSFTGKRLSQRRIEGRRWGVEKDTRAGEAPSFPEVIDKIWLIYFVALLYIYCALSVFRRSHSPPGSILTFFFLTCARYFISAALVVSRSLRDRLKIHCHV